MRRGTARGIAPPLKFITKNLSVLSLSLFPCNSVNLAGAAAGVVGNFFDANVWCVVCLQALKVGSIGLIENEQAGRGIKCANRSRHSSSSSTALHHNAVAMETARHDVHGRCSGLLDALCFTGTIGV